MVHCVDVAITCIILIFVFQKPMVTCQNAHLLRFANKHMPILSQHFWPTIWCFEGRLQTVVRALIKTEIPVKYRGYVDDMNRSSLL